MAAKERSVTSMPSQIAIICGYDPTRWFPVVQAAIDRLRNVEPMRVHYLPPDPLSCERIASLPINGLILDSGKLDWRSLTQLKVPIVDLADHGNSRPWPFVHYDQEGIGRMAAAHLIDRGIRRFAAFSPGAIPPWVARVDGFREGVRIHCPECPVGDDRDRVSEFLDLVLADGDLPVGIFVAEDDHAEWLIPRLLSRGIGIPRDVAVVGVGNQATAGFRCAIPISSVQFPTTIVGETAADILLDCMTDRPYRERPPIAPLRVVSRESTGPGAVRDGLTERAVQLMREYLADHSTTEAGLAEVLGVSAGTLRSRFMDVLGRLPSAVWRDLRIQAAQDLLIGTDMTVAAISRQCGYSGSRAFIRAFKAVIGQSPAVWRKAARVPVM